MSAGGCFLLSLESPPQEEMYSKGQKKIHAMVRTYGFSMFLEPSLTLF